MTGCRWCGGSGKYWGLDLREPEQCLECLPKSGGELPGDPSQEGTEFNTSVARLKRGMPDTDVDPESFYVTRNKKTSFQWHHLKGQHELCRWLFGVCREGENLCFNEDPRAPYEKITLKQLELLRECGWEVKETYK